MADGGEDMQAVLDLQRVFLERAVQVYGEAQSSGSCFSNSCNKVEEA